MIEIETESGAIYEWDVAGERVRRMSGPRPIDYTDGGSEWKGDEWADWSPVRYPEEGRSMRWVSDNGQVRTTTPVVRITEKEEL